MSINDRVPIASLDHFVRNDVEPGTLEQRVLTQRLLGAGSVKFNVSGDNYTWPVRFKRVGNFRTHDVFQEVTVTPEKTEVQATQPFGRYIQNEFIDEEEEFINKAPDAIYDMSVEKTEAMAVDAKDEFHLETHNGDAVGRRIKGINELLPTAFATIHGIVQTGNVFWQGVILDAALGPNTNVTTDLLERIRTGLTTADRGDGAGRPDFGITDLTIYGKLVDKHQAQERYTAEGKDISGELGFINVHNTPIYYDKQAQTNSLRLINSRKLKLLFRTPGMFKMGTKEPSNRTGVLLLLQMFASFVNINPRYHVTIHNYGF